VSTLVCLPFAGGNQSSFAFLRRHLQPDLRLKVLEYSGHGQRINAPLLDCLDAVVEDAHQQLLAAPEDDYLLFGHSMGACVAFLLAERLNHSVLPPPKHVFLSGHGVITERRRRQRHLLPSDQFFALLAEMQGTPSEILDCRELLELFEPILRADFAVLDNYRRTNFSPLPYSFTVLHGQNDVHTSRDSVQAWRRLCLGDFSFHEFSGGHFFIHDHPQMLAQLIADVAFG